MPVVIVNHYLETEAVSEPLSISPPGSFNSVRLDIRSVKYVRVPDRAIAEAAAAVQLQSNDRRSAPPTRATEAPARLRLEPGGRDEHLVPNNLCLAVLSTATTTQRRQQQRRLQPASTAKTQRHSRRSATTRSRQQSPMPRTAASTRQHDDATPTPRRPGEATKRQP